MFPKHKRIVNDSFFVGHQIPLYFPGIVGSILEQEIHVIVDADMVFYDICSLTIKIISRITLSSANSGYFIKRASLVKCKSL